MLKISFPLRAELLDSISAGNTVQRDFLLDHGCVKGQGYLFSRPLPTEEVEKLLLHSKPLDLDDS